MKRLRRKTRQLLRSWLQRVTSVFEPKARKGKWFETQYYTHLFTRNKHYSRPEANPEEELRWEHIRQLTDLALAGKGTDRFRLIVDLGCGRGWLSSKLGVFGPVIGIEPIARVVEHGRKIYPGLDLRVGDIKSIDGLEPDLIVCSEVIEHMNDLEQEECFRQFITVLDKGGSLIITTPRKEALKEWAGYVELEQPSENWLSEDELRKLAEEAGFTVIKKLTYKARPREDAPEIEVYQQWLFRKP